MTVQLFFFIYGIKKKKKTKTVSSFQRKEEELFSKKIEKQ